MTDQELKKLSRKELLELLIAEVKENERLAAQLSAAEEKLRSRELSLNTAGSIADASLRLSGIFDNAQTAADIYLENINSLNARQEEVCAMHEEECLRKCESLMRQTKARCDRYEAKTREKCIALLKRARTELVKKA